MVNGRLAEEFKNLGLINVLLLFYSGPALPTYINRRRQIDTTWISPDLHSQAYNFAPFYFGIGDYRLMIINFFTELFFGNEYVPMILDNPSIVSNYTYHAEYLFSEYKIQ